MTTQLDIVVTADYSQRTFAEPVDYITFRAGVTATFSATQFPSSILPTVTIEGRLHAANTVVFRMDDALTFSAAKFIVTEWEIADRFVIQGDDDPETITGSYRRDDISGNSGNDQINGSIGNDVQTGGAGFDSFVYTRPNQLEGDQIDGGLDDDMVWIQGNGAYTVASLSNVERLLIAPFSEGQQTDVSVTCGASSFGADGIREVYLCSGVTQQLTITGPRIDLRAVTFFDYDAADHAVILSGKPSGTAITTVYGSDIGEEIRGTAKTDQLAGNGGDDTIISGGGTLDVCSGGAGNDTFVFRSGDINLDHLAIDGGAGTKDRLACGTDFSSAGSSIQGIEVVEFTAGCTVTLGDMFFIALPGSSGGGAITQLIGSNGADTLKVFGSAWNAVDLGTLTFRNWSADDSIVMKGTSANEIFRMSQSHEDVTSGEGADTFVFRNGSSKAGAWHDVITDFAAGADKIDLSAVDANSLIAGDQQFRTVASFTGGAGQLRISSALGSTWLAGDTNGDLRPDFLLELNGTVKLSPGADLIL